MINLPLQILCLEQYSTLGGAQQSLLDVLPAFVERGWEPHVVVPGFGPLVDALASRGVPVSTVAAGRYSKLRKSPAEMIRYVVEQPRLLASMAGICRNQSFSLIYVNGPRVVPAASIIAGLFRIPLIFHCHNRLLQDSAVALTGRALQLSNAHVIACCRFAGEPLRPYVRPERFDVIFNGVRDMSKRPRPKKSNAYRIGVIGRIEAEKGQLEFVQAARLVARTIPNCQFRIIGSPMFSTRSYYDDVVSEAQDLEVAFQGWTGRVDDVLSELDLLVVPSHSMEATTRVILEAFSAEVPVVGFACGGIGEVVKDNRTGFLAQAFSAESLAQRILEALNLPAAEIDLVRQAAREEWQSRFNLIDYRQAVTTVMEKMMRANRRGRETRPNTHLPGSTDESIGKAATHSG
jgi:glycosyltransferase involved in cell wall biosynthesis